MLLLLEGSAFKYCCEYEGRKHSSDMEINENRASIVRSEAEFPRSSWVAPEDKDKHSV